ncbi:methylated-DNA--[protein]-cysteine S-methyltransferase [Pseudogulbenkiania subflava]|uniref:Methylated-DNA-[protein]-cysteine S-methyltransferase n=1 Tax=Pseudogulbenkiania subflava DSM 22618 TaxID=1123014 RepID=A0A1Y6B7K1_9NEIS|nr:methylated-DNA--[protein]-cysteine S-methyltransferase [Pseudogulbenkiania subflava]SME97043.1 methylated-DNA-[protein]-cysteine S-methyltransferase [Pseudogulbenkiania subflava DSM 22618]
MTYTAVIEAPFGHLGIVAPFQVVSRIEFLDTSVPLVPPEPGSLAEEVACQLQEYFQHSDFRFDLPCRPQGTAFQQRVWQAIADIPPGATVSYGAIAQLLDSSARAVGQACGNNPLPIVIPCHRVLARSGLGGFNHSSAEQTLFIKFWLLRHEQQR